MARALVLGAVTGKRRVAARMAAAALEARGHEVLLLPTQLLSGTYDLGTPAQLDATGYLLEALARWKEQGIAWDCVLLGGVTGMAQAEALCGALEESRARGAWVLLDPILGDSGRTYRSVGEEQVEAMRLLLSHADVATPNLTEACLLARAPYGGADAQALLDALCAGSRGVVVTSAKTPGGGDAVIGRDAQGEGFCFPFERAAGRHLATGDLFSACLADGLLRGNLLSQAALEAMRAVECAIRGEGDTSLPKD